MLKKVILNFKTKQNLKKREVQTHVDFESAKTIAILYSDQFENEESIAEIIKELEASGKIVRLMVFCHNPKKKTTSLPYFTAKDFSQIGDIKDYKIDDFVKDPVDFALCFDKTRHFAIDYVFSLLTAKCRIGIMTPASNHLFDMMVDGNNTNAPLSNEVLRYLKMIQTYEYQ